MANYTQTGGSSNLQGNLVAFGPPTGESLTYNGTSDFVEVPKIASLNSAALTTTATLEAWIYLNQLPSVAGHFMETWPRPKTATTWDLQVENEDNKVHFYVG